MRSNLIHFQIIGTVTNPAAETKSIGLHRLRVAATAEQGRPTLIRQLAERQLN
jgi:hypothetical protein